MAVADGTGAHAAAAAREAPGRGAGALPRAAVDTLLQALPFGVAWLDTGLHCRHHNSPWAALQERHGAELARLDGPEHQALLQRLLASGEPLRGWTPCRDDEGGGGLLLDIHPVADAQGPAGLLVLAREPGGEAALDRSEARFRRVVETAPDGMAMVNAQGRLVLVNAALERLFGWTREQLLGQSIECLMPEAVRARHPAWLAAFFQAPQARDMAARRELFALRRDGTLFPVEIGLNPIEIEGATHTLATIVDVTQRKADRAQIERALAEKTSLLQEVHHRVKNNLQVISSLLSLQSRQLEGSAHAALEQSRRRVQAMALIHQLLYERNDFSGATLALYLSRLCGLLRESLARPGVRLVLTVEPPADQFVLDMERAVPCGLLVNELVTNALKHAFAGGGAGLVEVRLSQADPATCLLSVVDDGVGLPDSARQGQPATLGLQLVDMLVDQLRAGVAVQVGPGTRFDIAIPAEVPT